MGSGIKLSHYPLMVSLTSLGVWEILTCSTTFIAVHVLLKRSFYGQG